MIITNASKVVLTGKKADHKTLRKWSGYPGGLKVARTPTCRRTTHRAW